MLELEKIVACSHIWSWCVDSKRHWCVSSIIFMLPVIFVALRLVGCIAYLWIDFSPTLWRVSGFKFPLPGDFVFIDTNPKYFCNWEAEKINPRNLFDKFVCFFCRDKIRNMLLSNQQTIFWELYILVRKLRWRGNKTTFTHFSFMLKLVE